MANFIGASRVDVDCALREERQHTADVGDNPVDLRKALEHPAVHEPRHGHAAVERPTEDQGRHDVDAGRFRRQRSGRMDVYGQLIFRQALINRKQFLPIQRLAVEIREASESA